MAEATPEPAATRLPAIMVRAAAFFRFFTSSFLLSTRRGRRPQHAMENAKERIRMRRMGDIHPTV
ncbi:hypothetical protein GCM10010381_56170 [Streptomyces xantholiticus]|nr:hypothetical protein GCM10010381_56170 [Streptomyces xantholiticus]